MVAIREAFDWFDQVLGVICLRRSEEAVLPVPVDEIERLIAERQAVRLKRDFKAADRIRDDLESLGIILEDTPAGNALEDKVGLAENLTLS